MVNLVPPWCTTARGEADAVLGAPRQRPRAGEERRAAAAEEQRAAAGGLGPATEQNPTTSPHQYTWRNRGLSLSRQRRSTRTNTSPPPASPPASHHYGCTTWMVSVPAAPCALLSTITATSRPTHACCRRTSRRGRRAGTRRRGSARRQKLRTPRAA